jgi:hypothetical protein
MALGLEIKYYHFNEIKFNYAKYSHNDIMDDIL